MLSLLLLIDCCIHHERLNELNSTKPEKWINLCFSYTQFVKPWISVGLLNELKHFPVTFRYGDAVFCIPWDIQVILCQLFRQAHNWRYWSNAQHESPVLSKTFTVNFETCETYISLLPTFFDLEIIYDGISKNYATKHILALTHLTTVGTTKLHFL
jgi:hypothetical protein